MFAKLFRRLRKKTALTKELCPYCEGNSLDEAHNQLSSGYYLGAVASARCDTLKRIRFLAREAGLLQFKKTGGLPKIRWMVEELRSQGLLPRNIAVRLFKVYGRSTAMLDGGPQCHALRARWVVEEMEILSLEIDKLIIGVTPFGEQVEQARMRNLKHRYEFETEA